MPKNFQISQYDEPICIDGYLDVEVDGRTVRVEIERVHMEEDTGKTLHVGGATGRIQGADYSLVDYNRAGIPLIEIVTKPVEGTGALAPEVARAYVTELREMMRDAGRLRRAHGAGLAALRRQRVAAPVAGRAAGHPFGDQERQLAALGGAGRALRDQRQAACCAAAAGSCRRPGTGTRTPACTTPGRSKEQAEDYRYFPEPDLVPIAPDPAWVEELRAALPEPPGSPARSCRRQWGLSDFDMQSLPNAGALRPRRGRRSRPARRSEAARKWWLGELARRANERASSWPRCRSRPAQVARVAALVDAGTLNDKLARAGHRGRARRGGRRPTRWSSARGLAVVSDEGALSRPSTRRSPANPTSPTKIRAGKVAAAGAIVGAVMKATRGQADAARSASWSSSAAPSPSASSRVGDADLHQRLGAARRLAFAKQRRGRDHAAHLPLGRRARQVLHPAVGSDDDPARIDERQRPANPVGDDLGDSTAWSSRLITPRMIVLSGRCLSTDGSRLDWAVSMDTWTQGQSASSGRNE